MLPIQNRDSQQKVLVTPKLKFEIPTMVLPIQNILMWGAILGIAVLLYIKTDVQITQVSNEVQPDTAKTVLANMTTVEFTELDIEEVMEHTKIINQAVNESQKQVMVQSLKKKTPMQPVNPSSIDAYAIAIWILKAEEIFTPHFYWDGKKEAIGFGKNVSSRSDAAIKPYLRDGLFTWDDGISVMKNHLETHITGEIAKYETRKGIKLTPQQKAGLMVFAYNTGRIDNFGTCCRKKGGKGYCGSKDSNIRIAHNRRRYIEALLMQNKLPLEQIQAYQKAAMVQEARWKKMESLGLINNPSVKTKIPKNILKL